MKLKYYLVLLALSALLAACKSPGLIISGKIASNSPITIDRAGGEQENIATIVPKNGRFRFAAKPPANAESYLLLANVKQPIGHFFIAEKGHIKIAADTAGNVRVTGTPLNDKLQRYHDERNLLFTSFKNSYFLHQEKRANQKKASEAELMQLKKEADMLDTLENKIKELDIQFAHDNINNIAGQLSLNNLILHHPTPEQLKRIMSAANTETQKTRSFKSLTSYIKQVEQTSLGGMFTDVELSLASGEKAAISSYLKKEKYLLLYVYIPAHASRHDFFQLNSLYKQYQNNAEQLKILAIALDESKDSWLKLQATYDMPFTQLVDTTGVDGAMATAYGLASFPYFIILGKNGTILLRSSSIANVKKVLESDK